MPRHHVQINDHIAASPEAVFDFLVDHESFGRIWPGKTKRVKVSADAEHPNGVGSTREIKVGPIPGLMIFREAITVYQRPNRIEYAIVGFAAIKNHLGTIQLSASADGGTDIDYHIEFDGRLPGIGSILVKDLPRQWAEGIVAVKAELES